MSFNLQMALLASYGLMLIYFGIKPTPGFASWHMFANLERTVLKLRHRDADGTETDLNPWEFLPHTYFSMNLAEALAFLQFLKIMHELELSGTIEVWHGDRRSEYKIHDSELAD